MVNFTVLCNVVLTPSKIIHHFENLQFIFTWQKMASMCAKFHCHTISSLEYTRVGHFCPNPSKIKYATPDTPNKIGLRVENLGALEKTDNPTIRIYIKKLCYGIAFNIKSRYYLELLTLKPMKLLENTKSTITTVDHSENVPHLENIDILVHFNHNNNCQQDSKVLYTSIPNKLFCQFLDISPKIFLFP